MVILIGKEQVVMKGNSGPLYTPLCEILGIQYPIIQGAMGMVTDAPFVAAVSNAGALGVIASVNVPLRQLKDEIARVKDLTDKPFAVNLVPLGATFQQRAEIVAQSDVKIVTTGRGDPRQPVVSFLKTFGVKVLPVVPSVRHAKRLEEEGADIIIASGMEGGGHVGKICTLPFIPQVVEAVKVPVVAAGGFGDGRGLVAALALGAFGIQMGTRFIATEESTAHPRFKQMLIEATEEDTLVTSRFTGKTARVLKNRLAEYYHRLETEGEQAVDLEEVNQRGWWKKQREGNTDEGMLAAGQIAGLIKEIEPVESLIKHIVEEASAICARLGSKE
jgi:enoyl-[acyl-carrier protein] reductase II